MPCSSGGFYPLLLSLAALPPFHLIGCRSGQVSPYSAVVVTPTHRDSYLEAVNHVQSLSLYHQEEGAYRKHHYLEAVH